MEHFPASKEKREQELHRQSSLKLISDVIDDCIPYIEKTAYLEVLEKSPHLIIKETDPLRFLKYEKWNMWAAAQRTVKYWEWKRTLFGDVRTFRSITDLTGAGALDEHEVALVRTGFIATMPLDAAGNVIGFMNRSRCGNNPPFDSFDTAKKCRLYFYFACTGVNHYYENQDYSAFVENGANETGFILINLVSCLPPSPTVNLRDMVNQGFPIHILRMHVIFYPENTNYFSFEKYIIPTFLSLNAPLLGGFTKLSFHYCSSPIDAAPKLQQHGIPLHCIPAVLGGLWSYDAFEDWLFFQTFVQGKPIADVGQAQRKCLQSSPISDPYLCESELRCYQSSNLSLCRKELIPNLVEELSSSQNSNYGNMEVTDELFDFDVCFDDKDIMDESSRSVVPLVNWSGAIENEQATAPNTDRSLHVQQFDTSYDYNSDRVESECDSVSSPNRINNYTDRWSEKFMELCKYREKMGHCLVPQMYAENAALGAWVKRQRYQYKLTLEGKPSNMTDERLKALTDIGFVWDSQVVVWCNQLYELELFKQKHQHCNVPATYSQDPRLATWVKRQRRQYKLYCDNKASTMTPERIHELEKLGFEWDGLLKKS